MSQKYTLSGDSGDGDDGGTHRETLKIPKSRGNAGGGDDDAAGDTPAGPRWRPPTLEEVGRAAALCFRNEERDEAIARRLGVSRRTLVRWKRRPEYAAAYHALLAFYDEELRRERTARWGHG
ncbi:MAG: helix-turn-helix domain-containing protein [Chloroflexota bacterium]|nr:helix-turn-helix domain-containing protein [Chloroflexota bacterium]